MALFKIKSGTKWRREGGTFVLTDYRVNEIIVHAKRNYIGILFYIHTQYHMILGTYSSLSITIGTLQIKIQSNLLKRLNLLVSSYKNVIARYLIPNVRSRYTVTPNWFVRTTELTVRTYSILYIFFQHLQYMYTMEVYFILGLYKTLQYFI